MYYEDILRKEKEKKQKISDEAHAKFWKATAHYIYGAVKNPYKQLISPHGVYDGIKILGLYADAVSSLRQEPSDSPLFDLKNCLPFQNAKELYDMYKNLLKEYEDLNKICNCTSPHEGGCECVKEAEDKYKQIKLFYNHFKNNLLPNYQKDIENWYNNRVLEYFRSEILNMKNQYDADQNRHIKNNKDKNREIAEGIVRNKDYIKDFVGSMLQGDMTDEEFAMEKANYGLYVDKFDNAEYEHQVFAILYGLEQSQRDKFDQMFQEDVQKLLDACSIGNLEPNIFLVAMAADQFLPTELGWLANKETVDYVFDKIEREVKLPQPPGECDCNPEEEKPITDPIADPIADPDNAKLAPIQASPIILDLDGDGVETTSISDGVYFDHDNNLFAEKTAWVGADDALLVLDANKNGQIDGGSELFGNNFMLKNGDYAKNGFEALAEFDTNGDGIVNNNDERWAELKLWP